MKRLFLAPLLALTLAPAVASAAALFYVNDGLVNATNPPMVDAINFVNNNTFEVFTSLPYTTSSTLNFTNRGTMNGSPGFDFETFPPGNGVVKMASSFYNKSTGLTGGAINCSGGFSFVITPFQLFGNLTGNSKFIVGATNILNSGSVTMDASSLIDLHGHNIDLTRGALIMQDTFTLFTGIAAFFNAGVLDGYWGVNFPTNAFRASTYFNNFQVTTPFELVTLRNNQPGIQHLVLDPANTVAYVHDTGIVGSNRFVQAVFIENTNSAFINTVFFTPFEIAVQWQWTNLDFLTGSTVTNFLLLEDDFGETTNAPRLRIDGFIGARPTFIPDNYFFSSSTIDATNFFGPPATPGLPPTTFDSTPSTNQSTSYEGLFNAATQTGSDLPGQDITNISGRIEIRASKFLNLKLSRIGALNTLILQATNHYAGNDGARISAPYYDINLRSTNGLLTITNLVPETLPHPDGTCELWSGRWTNVVNDITNSFHALVILSSLSPTTKPLVETLTLQASTNLVISDQLNITRSLLLTAPNLTLTTNGTGASSTVGSLNFLSQNILWPTSTPLLQNLTNWGYISALNAVFFGGSRGSPFYNTTFNEPYLSFVNHGGITNQGSLIWSKYFENTGTFSAHSGAISLDQTADAFLIGGSFLARSNDISIHAGNLTVTNHPLLAGGALNLWITNSLIGGGGLTNGNIFTAADGFNLFLKPATGDLLGTTVTNTAPPYGETLNFWAGEDRGANNAGFVDNVAVGRLVLNAYTNSAFFFIGTDTDVGLKNALYVDRLELQGTATNITYDGTSYVLQTLEFDDNMTIYYADATMNGLDVSEHINGANHGHLVWVPSYAGNFSTVTLSWTNGIGGIFFYTVNQALRNSTFIDSDGDGLVNAVDPTPLGDPPPGLTPAPVTSASIALSVVVTRQPSAAAMVSWITQPGSTNYLYAKSSYATTNWVTVTNFVYKGQGGRVTVKDPITSPSPRFYRVRVDPFKGTHTN